MEINNNGINLLINASSPRFMLRMLQILLMCMTLQFPLIGSCNTGGWLTHLFESKGNPMQDVATQVAELPEDNYIYGLNFSPDGKYLAASSVTSRTIHIWDWRVDRIVHSVEKADGANEGLSTEPIRYSPDGKLLAICHEKAANNIVVRIWNANTWEIVHDIEDPDRGMGCNAVGFSPDGESLIRIVDRIGFPGDNLIVYDTSTWQAVWGLRTKDFQSNSLAISPDGKFVALGGGHFVIKGNEFDENNLYNAGIVIVSMAQHTIIRTIDAFSNVIGDGLVQMSRLAWQPNGTQIAAGVSGIPFKGGDGIRIFDAESGEQVANEPVPIITGIRGLRYTPDGKYLIEAGVGGKTVSIWDGQHHALLQTIPLDMKAMNIAVSADGHYFAVAGYRDIQVWQLK